MILSIFVLYFFLSHIALVEVEFSFVSSSSNRKIATPQKDTPSHVKGCSNWDVMRLHLLVTDAYDYGGQKYKLSGTRAFEHLRDSC